MIMREDDGATKKCSRCGKTKHLSMFTRDSNRRLGRRSECKECESEARRKNITSSRVAKSRSKNLRAESSKEKGKRARKTVVWIYKKWMGCEHCGRRLDPKFLHLHHRDPNEKSDGISEMVAGGASMKKLFIEITKCDSICWICHEELHASERTEDELFEAHIASFR